MTFSVVVPFLTAVLVVFGSSTPRECVWESPGNARVTITYYQKDGRYLRYNDVRVEILRKEGFVAASPQSRHGRFWFIFAWDSAGELVAEDDYVPPVVNLSPKGAGAKKKTLSPELQQLAQGAVLVERVDWDKSLLRGMRWNAEERYRIRPANRLWLRISSEEYNAVIPTAIEECLIPDARVVVGDEGASAASGQGGAP